MGLNGVVNDDESSSIVVSALLRLSSIDGPGDTLTTATGQRTQPAMIGREQKTFPAKIPREPMTPAQAEQMLNVPAYDAVVDAPHDSWHESQGALLSHERHMR